MQARLADGFVAGLTDDDLSRVYEVNLMAAFRMLRSGAEADDFESQRQHHCLFLPRRRNVPASDRRRMPRRKRHSKSFVRITARETATRGIQSQRRRAGITRRRHERHAFSTTTWTRHARRFR